MADEILPGDCLPHGERRRYVAPHRFYIPEPGCTCERAVNPTVVENLDPAAVERATEVLTTHQRRDSASCLCGWSRLGYSFTQHQADALAAGGLLVTPEHYAQVAARALREAAEAIPGSTSPTPVDPYDLAAEWLLDRADHIERQEGDR